MRRETLRGIIPRPLLPLILFGVVLALAYSIYQQAADLPLQFDDAPNLKGLAQVEDARSALLFIGSGHAGPLGRPLALASFLIEGNGWPHSLEQMRRVNTWIHLLNGLLVFYLGYLLSRRLSHHGEASAAWAALGLASLWVLSPLLLSTSLMLVQRMTSLAATFVLSGLILYLKGRALLRDHPGKALALMTTGILGGTLLAVLSKENGALLPLYALVLEVILPVEDRRLMQRHRLWKVAVLWLPVTAIVAFLILELPHFRLTYEMRDFTLGERLLTEARILWDYVRLALTPRSSALGPFHDDWIVSQGLFSPWTTLISLVAWAGLVLGGLAMRRRFPILLFAVLWYLGGHVLESSVAPLELYFAHRNYLPVIGILFALSQLPFIIPRTYLKTAAAGLLGLASLQALVAWQTTRLWSQPLVAAELWHRQAPTSTRAAQNLSQEYLKRGWVADALRTLEETWERYPDSSSLALQTLQGNCVWEKDPVVLEGLFDRVRDSVAKGNHEFVVADAIHKLVSIGQEGGCKGILTQERLVSLIDTLLANPRLTASGNTRANLYAELSRIYVEKKDLDLSVRYLQKSFAADPHPETALLAAAFLASGGLFDDARRELDDALTKAPWNPLARWRWQTLIGDYRKQLDALQRLDRAQSAKRVHTAGAASLPLGTDARPQEPVRRESDRETLKKSPQGFQLGENMPI